MKHNWTVTFEGVTTGAVITIDVIVDSRRVPYGVDLYRHAAALAWGKINNFVDPESDEEFIEIGVVRGGEVK